MGRSDVQVEVGGGGCKVSRWVGDVRWLGVRWVGVGWVGVEW